MTGILGLDWAIISISLLNTILLIWLGMTVLLNAERRTWGSWLATSGLLLGGLFFISHTIILGFGWDIFRQSLDFWWQVGLVPIVVLPFVWYLMMLWYSGFWNKDSRTLHKKHKAWFFGSTLFTITLVGFTLYQNPVPSYSGYAASGLIDTLSIAKIPVLLILYPVYVIYCVVLSIDAIRYPGSTDRVMGTLARNRAKPWLSAASIVLLIVGLLVAVVFGWVFQFTYHGGNIFLASMTVGLFDLAIESLIAAAIILLGQAIVAYEIFTGKALPRQGLLRYWQRAIVLAVGYGAIIGLGVGINLEPIYSLLLTTLLMVIFYALIGWRSYSERERYINNLRPFVASHRFFDHLTTPSKPQDISLKTPFNALCEEVIGAKKAFLISSGPLAPLVGPPLTYPEGEPFEFPEFAEIINSYKKEIRQQTQISALRSKFASWSVPLWSERGLIGILLLGDKKDGGLYTQEEVDIAQASCERLIDTKASLEIAKKLMVLQRQRLAESQILDQKARRVLHDDVLQQLHTAMLNLVSEQGKPNSETSEAIEILADVHRQISNLLREMPTTSMPEIVNAGLIGAIRKLIDEELGQSFEEVRWNVSPEAERQFQDISPLTAEVLYYATREVIRNAAKHGRQSYQEAPLHLSLIFSYADDLIIQIEDDGKGFGSKHIMQESDGHGLALHSTMMAVIGGELTIESKPGKFTKITLTLPQI